jgi:acetyltransferase
MDEPTLSPLRKIFEPRSIAIIGATDREGTVGRAVLVNLSKGTYSGKIYAVNPKYDTLLGIQTYPSVGAIAQPIDLAVIVTPAATVPGVMKECVAAGVLAAIIISAGFKEIGAEGYQREQEILQIARAGKMRLIGPNCLGVMNTFNGMNATFASEIPNAGDVAFISQSGALCTAILDWSLQENVGFSKFVSVGSMLDVGWGDLIDYLKEDIHTKSILIYMESVGNVRSFMSAARETALNKPIIIMKPGVTEAAAKAAASHTGSMVGSDDVLDAAFRRCGVLRVRNISELFHMAELLAKQPRPLGPNLTIVTNAGGPGVIASDAVINAGGKITSLVPETISALNRVLPEAWSHNNPIDVLGDANYERIMKATEIALKDPNTDGLLVVLTPQAITDPMKPAEALIKAQKPPNKPILASWMGGSAMQTSRNVLNLARIPTFNYPDVAAVHFAYMWDLTENLNVLYETPQYVEIHHNVRAQANALIENARLEGRTLLSEVESKQVLDLYEIPVTKTVVAMTQDQAINVANELGYPVVLKLHSHTITHKTDVGGVKLNLKNADEVKQAFTAIQAAVTQDDFLGVAVQPMISTSDESYELLLGSSIDPQFGPVLLVGAGGQLVEILKDRSLGLPPLNTTLARHMIERMRIYDALNGVRGRRPVSIHALEQTLVKFSRLVVQQRWIKEIDINPLIIGPDGAIALDARVVLHPNTVTAQSLPRLAIRPYPAQYTWQFTDKTGESYTIRPIMPEDEPLIRKFHMNVSEYVIYLRYFHSIALAERISHERLMRLCFVDYDRHIALVIEQTNAATGERQIVGVGRIIKDMSDGSAEWAVLIGDQYQRRGIGSALLGRLIDIARAERIPYLVADVLPQNAVMKAVANKLGFESRYDADEQVFKYSMSLL